MKCKVLFSKAANKLIGEDYKALVLDSVSKASYTFMYAYMHDNEQGMYDAFNNMQQFLQNVAGKLSVGIHTTDDTILVCIGKASKCVKVECIPHWSYKIH